MYNFPMRSLEHIALVKTTIALWMEDDIWSNGIGLRNWRLYQDRVKIKVPDLLLPKSLENKVLNLVEAIGLELKKLKEFHEIVLPQGILRRESLNKLCWTPQGTVDKRKTAEILTKYENLDIKHRFKLACIYCLDNDHLTLWNKLPKSDRERFYSVENPGCVKQPELVVFWTYYIKGEVDRIEASLCKRNPYQYAFQTAAVRGNKVATEYFFQKLTPKEREESLVKYAGEVAYLRCQYPFSKDNDFSKTDYADVLCFLLSQMSEKQQMEVFERRPREVLKCFLDWPRQSFFLDTAIRMWDILPPEGFYSLLYYIVDTKIKSEYTDYNYQKLFKEFWQQSSTTHKRYVIECNCKRPSLIEDLIYIGKPDFIKEIFDFANTTEREKIFLSIGIEYACENIFYCYRWGKLKLFVQECLSSNDILIKFRDMMKQMEDKHMKRDEKYIMYICEYETTLEEEKEKWTKLSQLLDDLIQKNNKKRSLEEVNRVKRHCSLTSE